VTTDPQDRESLRSGDRLRSMISQPSGRDRPETRGEPGPGSTYEAVTRQMVRALRDEVRDIKHRINQLITLIIAAILLEVLMRLIGVGL
jgi:hypothetical protein